MATNFGRYKVAEELGRGAMGVVYRAVDPTIGRTVAIKAINRGYLESVGVKPEEYAERFAREAQVAGALNHPNVVKIYDLGVDYLVMEYVEGQTVAALLRSQGRLARSQALRVVSEAAAALDHAHASGVVHRDIKPANLMLQADGTTKVMDFGLARIESSTLTAAGEILGSAAYMAPEVVLGQAADARSDLFSLGVVAYELITGLRPFTGPTVSSIIHHVVRSEPRPARDLDASLPAEVDAVFARVLAKNPEHRHANASAFAQALAACPWDNVPDEAPRALPMAPGPLDPTQATMVLATASAILAPGAMGDEGTGTVMSIDESELAEPLAQASTPAEPAGTPAEGATDVTRSLRAVDLSPPAAVDDVPEPTAATVILRAPVLPAASAAAPPAVAAPIAPAPVVPEVEDGSAATVVLRVPSAAPPAAAPPAVAAPIAPAPAVPEVEDGSAATVVLRVPSAPPPPAAAPPAVAAPIAPAPAVPEVEDGSAATVVLRVPSAAPPAAAPPAVAAPIAPTPAVPEVEDGSAATVVLRVPSAPPPPATAPPAVAAPIAPAPAVPEAEDGSAATVVLRAPASAPIAPDAPTPPTPLPVIRRPATTSARVPTPAPPAAASAPAATPPAPVKVAAAKPAAPGAPRKRSSLGLVLLLLFFILGLFAVAAGGFYWFVHRQAAREALATPTPAPSPETTPDAPVAPVETAPPTPADEPVAEPTPTDAASAAPTAAPSPDASPAARPATLVIESEPAGASVTIGKRRRGVTPVRLALPAGTVSVVVEKDGYKPWRADARLAAGATRTLNARLEALAVRPPVAPPQEATPAPAKPSVREGDLVLLGPEVTAPRRVGGDAARLPNNTGRLRLPASVLVEFVVDIDGGVREPRIVESAGDVLDEAALTALRTWRYEPARSHGLRVRVVQRAKFSFVKR